MELTASGGNTNLNLASMTAGQWTDSIELVGVDWLHGNSSDDALKQQIEQGYLVTGFII